MENIFIHVPCIFECLFFVGCNGEYFYTFSHKNFVTFDTFLLCTVTSWVKKIKFNMIQLLAYVQQLFSKMDKV